MIQTSSSSIQVGHQPVSQALSPEVSSSPIPYQVPVNHAGPHVLKALSQMPPHLASQLSKQQVNSLMMGQSLRYAAPPPAPLEPESDQTIHYLRSNKF